MGPNHLGIRPSRICLWKQIQPPLPITRTPTPRRGFCYCIPDTPWNCGIGGRTCRPPRPLHFLRREGPVFRRSLVLCHAAFVSATFYATRGVCEGSVTESCWSEDGTGVQSRHPRRLNFGQEQSFEI